MAPGVADAIARGIVALPPQSYVHRHADGTRG